MKGGEKEKELKTKMQFKLIEEAQKMKVKEGKMPVEKDKKLPSP